MAFSAAIKWQYQAAFNIKIIFNSELEFQSIEEIAERLSRAFDNVMEYNEAVRICYDLEPEEKIWLVIPS
jgi:predicted transglutaminase-like protease